MSSKKRQTPVEIVVEAFGVRPLAAELGCEPSTVHRWTKRDDGLIPSEWHQPILALAKREKVNITAETLINGR
jgi:methylphosphotriester-DNA--protein-cysteine methyltransferase